METRIKQTIKRLVLEKGGVKLNFEFVVGPEIFKQIDLFTELVEEAKEELKELKEETLKEMAPPGSILPV